MTESTMVSSRGLPEPFLWGASSGAHQVEGGNTSSDWWWREHGRLPGAAVYQPSGDAADSYHRYGEDMRLLADAGLTAYRFSIEWARIQPERGFVSRAAVDHYRRMVDTACQLGLEPVITFTTSPTRLGSPLLAAGWRRRRSRTSAATSRP